MEPTPWLPQLSDLSKQKIGYNSVNFPDIELKIGVLVADSYSQQKCRKLADHKKPVFRNAAMNYWNKLCLSVRKISYESQSTLAHTDRREKPLFLFAVD